MQRQGSFAEAEYAGKKKQTRRDKFLADMEQVVPWARLEERLRPLYPKGERGRPPIPLGRMLRVYFVQQWYGLSDEGLEDAFEPPPNWWTPLVSSERSGKVSNGSGTASLYG